MSQETFERVLNAIYAGLPADIEQDDPQRYQDMINLIEGCVTRPWWTVSITRTPDGSYQTAEPASVLGSTCRGPPSRRLIFHS